MEPIQLDYGGADGPGDWILPIRYVQAGAADEPRLVEYWQWLPAASPTERGRWVRVSVVGDG